MQAAALKSQCD